MMGVVVQESEKYRIVCSVLRGGSGITGSVDSGYKLPTGDGDKDRPLRAGGAVGHQSQ